LRNDYGHQRFLEARLKARDQKAFEYLYDNYSAALYSIILSTVRDEYIAEETLQDVFLKIWDQIEHYENSKGTIFTWIYRIARNKAIDVTRSKDFKSMEKSNALENYVHTSKAGHSNPYGADLNQMLGVIGEECKKLLYSNFYMGYSHVEMAEKDQIPLGTVKTKIRACLKKLRALMSKEFE